MFTPVRLLVRVVEHVLVVGLLEGEGLATDVARVRGLAWSWGRHVNIVNCDFRTIWTQFKWLYFLLVAHKRLICLDRSSSGQTNSCQRNFTVFFIIFREGNYKGFPYFLACVETIYLRLKLENEDICGSQHPNLSLSDS